MAAKLEKGDHLTVPLDVGVGTHHGIHVGNDEVIHFTSPGRSKAKRTRIVSDTIAQFALGRPITIVPYDSSCRSREQVVEEALRHLRDSERYPAYDAMENNCEHFVNLCKTGKKTSSQARTVTKFLTFGSVAYFGWLGIPFAWIASKVCSLIGNHSS